MKFNNPNGHITKKRISIFVMILSLGIAFSMIFVPTVGATLTPVRLGALILGGLVGNFLYDIFVGENAPDNPALQISQENLLLAWEGSAERINNQFKQSDADVMNFVNLFNVSYLYWMRQAEHEVADVISYPTWYDAKANMSAFTDFEDSLKSFMISQLSKYSAIDIYAIRDMLDTNDKTDISVNDGSGQINPSTFVYGLQPFVDDRNTEWYLIDVYVPTGESLNIDGHPYTHGIYQFGGEICNITSVSSDSVFITGFPTDYDIFTRHYYNVTDELITNSLSGNTRIYINRNVDSLTVTAVGANGGKYVDDGGSHPFPASCTQTYIIIGKLQSIEDYGNAPLANIKCSYSTHDIFYRPDALRLYVHTSLAGDVDINQYLANKDVINFYNVIIPYLQTIEDNMELQAHILFNYYHNHGWFTTDDIPSNYLVLMPDFNFDNIYALMGVNLTEATFIYYNWLKQLDNQTLWVNPNIDSTDISISDFSKYMIKGKLTHGGNIIFDNAWLWVVPQTGDLNLVNNSNNILTQSVLMFIPSTGLMYMGYVGDTLHVYALTEDGDYQDNMTIGRTTLQDFLVIKYGFDVSVFGDWVFPTGIDITVYTTLAIIGIVAGIPIYAVGKYSKGKNGKGRGYLKVIGILMIIGGVGYLVYLYILYPLVHFFGFI